MTAPDRPPTDGAADPTRADSIRTILAEREGAAREAAEAEAEREARDDELLDALREWAKPEFGSVDWLAVEVARRSGLSFGHVRNVLYGQKRSAAVLDDAVALFRERTGDARPAEAA